MASVTAERDAARADVPWEREHAQQRVQDLRDTYEQQLTGLRAAAGGVPAGTTAPRTRARKKPSPDVGD